jgi:hypothetical protein
MADPAWIKKTIIFSAVFAVPAVFLLTQVRSRANRATGASLSFRIAVMLLAVYVLWALNVTFELSVGFMIAWPLFGIALSAIGAAAALWKTSGERVRLLTTNLLLLALHVSSIVAPN